MELIRADRQLQSIGVSLTESRTNVRLSGFLSVRLRNRYVADLDL